jgi:hypothetical protein
MILILMTSACDLKIHDEPPPRVRLQFEDEAKVNCISKTIPYFEAFLKGEPEGSHVKEFWDCNAMAMSSFKTKVKGIEEGVFSAKSLAVFLETYFLDHLKISDALIEEAMRLKQIFFGGSITNFNLQEIDQLVLVFKKMGELTESIYPYMILYTGKWKPKNEKITQGDLDYFENGSEKLNQLVEQLIEWVHLDNADYPIDNFLVFLHEFDKMMNRTVDFSSPVEKLFPVLKKLKVMLASGSADFIAPTEWKSFLVLGSRGYLIYLRWSLFFKDRIMSMAEQIWNGSRIIDEGFLLISQLLENNSDTKIFNKAIFDTLMQFREVYPGFNISQTLVDEFMHLKGALLGSSSNYWARSDFVKARSKVHVLKDLAIKTLPYLDIWTEKWKPDAKNPKSALEYLNQSLSVLSNLSSSFIELWEAEYDLARMGLIFKELTFLYPQEKTFVDLGNQWARFFPLVLSTKKIILGKEASLISPSDWNLFFKPALNFYVLYLNEFYFPNKESFFSEAGLSHWILVLNSVFQEFEKTVQLRKDLKIPVVEIEQLIQSAISSNLIQISKKDSIELLYQFMKVKKSLLASAEDYWVADDFHKVQGKLQIIKTITVDLLPHFEVYFGDFHYRKNDRSAAKKQVDFAFFKLKESCPGIITLLESSIDLSVVSRIFLNLEKIFSEKETVASVRKNWDRLLPVFVAMQNMLIGKYSTEVSPKELNLFLRDSIELFEVYMNEKYFPLEEKTFFSKTSINYWFAFANAMTEPIEKVLRNQKKAQIKMDKINFLFKSLSEAHLFAPSPSQSQKLLEELMEIKKALIGSSSEALSAQDFADLRPKLALIKDFVIDVLPYLKVVKNTWTPDYKNELRAKEFLQDMFFTLEKHKYNFTSLWRASFDWVRIPNLLQALIAVAPENEELIELELRWKKYFPVVISAKQIITSSSSTQMGEKEWESFYQPALDFYKLYLSYSYFVSKKDFLAEQGFLGYWEPLISSAIYQLSQVNLKRGEIPVRDFLDFLLILKNHKIVELDFDLNVIKKFVPLLLNRFLVEAKNRRSQRSYHAVLPVHIEFISQVWINWVQAQKFVFSTLEILPSSSLKWGDFRSYVGLMSERYKNNKALSLSIQQMRNAMLSPQYILLDKQNLLAIGSSQSNEFLVDARGLTTLNSVRTAVSVTLNAYLPSERVYVGVIGESDFKIFISDLIPLLKELGWLKSVKEGFAESRFLEANLFVPSGDGNEILSFQEGVELISMLISGVRRSQDLIVGTERNCHYQGAETVDLNCFHGVAFSSRKLVYQWMPYWLKFNESLSRDEFEIFYSYLEQGAEVDFVGENIYVPDLVLLTNLSQYVEMTFLRFNKYDDDILDTEEAMLAFPVFNPLLTKLSKLKDQNQVRALFAYILKNGRAPDQDIAGLIEFGVWANNPSSWDLKVNRSQLAKIFSYIQSEKKKQKK